MSGTDRDLEPWIHPALHLGESEINGQGLFTGDGLIAGEPVVRWGGRLVVGLSDDDARIDLEPHTAVAVAEGVLLAAKLGQGRTADDYMNHSCDPNVGMSDALTLVTISDVAAGAELTADYAFWTSDEGYELGSACSCGAERCRGTVTGRDWALPGLRAVQDHFSPFLRRRIAALDNDQ
ncbi:MAG TPA: SET domain-containing protein-lysine N-methyltransferase [Solirubrobacteraceae bacterium]|nr:SET domain-containing protein-lysine N-methyltransferase [Solirubrobacteraceae bacterium]